MYDLKKGLKYSYNYAMKHKLLVLLALLILIIVILAFGRREGFRFPQPNLSLELECKDFGWMCCSSSYTTNPFMIQKCMGGDAMGLKMFYKWENELGEVITSGLYDNYVQHFPGAYIRFSDNKLYKLLSTNPQLQPSNCKIVNATGKESDESIPGTLYSA